MSQQGALLSCLEHVVPTDRLLNPTENAHIWAAAAKPHNLRLAASVGPLAILYGTSYTAWLNVARTPAEISEAVTCAAALGVAVVARSGGHSYAAYSLGGSVHSAGGSARRAEPSLVIDLRGFRHLDYDRQTKRIRVGSGAMLGELINELERFGRNVPTGSCPTVGVGGQALAGGFGLMSRSLGLLLDNIVEADMVLADGRIATVSNEENKDLYWAIRGAGPSFGIVHSLTFKTYPTPQSVIYYAVTLQPRMLPFSQESIERAARLYQTFEDFGESEDAVPELGMSWHVTPECGVNCGTKIEIIGQFSGNAREFESVKTRLGQRLRDAGEGSFTIDLSEHSFIDAAHMVGGNWTRLEDRGDYNTNEHENFYAKSMLTKTRVPSRSMIPHLSHLLQLAVQPIRGVEWFVLAPFLGGSQSAIVHNGGQESSFGHRDLRTVWEIYAKSDGESTVDLVQLVDGMAADLEPVEAVYPAYVDERIPQADYPKLIWGDSYPRLQALKAKYDPKEVFRFPQSVRPAGLSWLVYVVLPFFVVVALLILRRSCRRIVYAVQLVQ